MNKMKVSNDVKLFLEELNKSNYKDIIEIIALDISKFEIAIGNRILEKRLNLDLSWNSFIVTDIDVYYQEDTLKFADRLDMYGIRHLAPNLKLGDIGMVMLYRFSSLDVFGNIMDTITGYHLSIIQGNGKTRNKRIVVYS